MLTIEKILLMSTRESEIEKKIRLYVESTGGYFHKLNSAYDPGIPDRLAVWPNCSSVYVELKKRDGTVSPQQQGKIGSLKRNGFRVHVIRSLNAFKEAIENYSDIQTAIENNAKFRKPKKRTKARHKVLKR